MPSFRFSYEKELQEGENYLGIILTKKLIPLKTNYKMVDSCG